MSETKARKAERAEYAAKLREMLQPGDTLYTVLRSVSRSGMKRTLDVYVMRDNEPLRLTWWIATACGFSYDKRHEAIAVAGCGMDVGFEVVYNLGRTLWPDGVPCIGEKCRSNDHANGDRDRTPHGHRGPNYIPGEPKTLEHWHRDSGYALIQRWMG